MRVTVVTIPPYFQRCTDDDALYTIYPQGFDTLAERIAKAMGDGWHVCTDHYLVSNMRRIRKGDYALNLWLPSGYITEKEAEKPKLNISGCYWLKDAKESLLEYGLNRTKEEINVTATRGSSVIVREIKRRLLKDYMAHYDSAIASFEKFKEAENNRKQLLLELAQMLGTTLREHNEESFNTLIEAGYVHIQASSKTVTMNLRSISPYHAKAIIEILKN